MQAADWRQTAKYTVNRGELHFADTLTCAKEERQFLESRRVAGGPTVSSTRSAACFRFPSDRGTRRRSRHTCLMFNLMFFATFAGTETTHARNAEDRGASEALTTMQTHFEAFHLLSTFESWIQTLLMQSPCRGASMYVHGGNFLGRSLRWSVRRISHLFTWRQRQQAWPGSLHATPASPKSLVASPVTPAASVSVVGLARRLR